MGDGSKPLKCKSGVPRKPFVPQAHQLRASREFLETSERGLLFYHTVGSGKTCAAYLATDLYNKTKGKRKIYILSPASLASSHQHQYCNVCGENPNEYHLNYKFYSYNDRQGIVKKLPKNMNDSIIIIDEIQEVVNGKDNESKTLSHVYDTVLRAERVKIILLSGTPIFAPFQCSLILNLLSPGITSMDETTFLNDIERPGYLARKCKGLISYVPVPNPEYYPTRIVPDIVETFPMSDFQFEAYKEVRIKELEEKKIFEDRIHAAMRKGNLALAKKLKAMQFIQTTKLKSRQLCNFAYPEDQKDEGKLLKGTDLNAKWILNDEDLTHVGGLKEYSRKMAKLVHRCLTIPGKHMVYGWFKTRYGLYLIQTYLKHCGLDPLIFSGDLGSDEKRAAIINKFNAEDNIRGEKHKVILVSGAGAMGISLFGIRSFHNFEAGTNEFISDQAEGRAFRTFSHHQLPPDERTVQVYRYFSGLPVDEDGKVNRIQAEYLTSEQQMYSKAIDKKKLTEKVLDIMKRAAFDCREPYNSAIKNCFDLSDATVVVNHNEDYDFGEQEAFEEEVVEENKE